LWIEQTADNGFIIAGSSKSNDGDVSGHHGLSTEYDYWIIKTDNIGNIQWQNSYGGTQNDYVSNVQQTMDRGYILSGSSLSNNGDVTGHHGTLNPDCWILKIDSSGIPEWEKSLGGSDIDYGHFVIQSDDGGFVVANHTFSLDGDVSGHHGTNLNPDSWIVKLNNIGTILWQKSLGGSDYEAASCIQQTVDGGFIISGISKSTDGDVTLNHGTFTGDYWIVKLDTLQNVSADELEKPQLNTQIIPNPFSSETKISFLLSNASKAKIEIHDLSGRLIKDFINESFVLGKNEIIWNGTNDLGAKVDKGVYFISIISDFFIETTKVELIKN
jgi:hypothetical protein